MTLPRAVAYAVGVAAALSLPFWVGSKRLAQLFRESGELRGRRGDPADALRAAHRALGLLARTRLPWWRNTCLYRALVECLVLRRYGIACRVELGVAGAGEAIGAHAWVARGDAPPEPAAGSIAVRR